MTYILHAKYSDWSPFWSGWTDSNRRPSAPKADALPVATAFKTMT